MCAHDLWYNDLLCPAGNNRLEKNGREMNRANSEIYVYWFVAAQRPQKPPTFQPPISRNAAWGYTLKDRSRKGPAAAGADRLRFRHDL